MNFIKLFFVILFTMPLTEKYKILSVPDLKEYVIRDGRDFMDFNYQLPGNYCSVYHLKDGKVILIPNHMLDDQLGLLIFNRTDFDAMVKADKFPIENSDKTLFELEPDRMEEIHKNIAHYQEWLNERTGLEYKEINEDILNKYCSYVSRSKKKGNAVPKDYVAIAVVLGEYLRQQDDGRWMLYKQYGTFNPYYDPSILHKDNSYEFIFPKIWSYMDTQPDDFTGFFNMRRAIPNRLKAKDFIREHIRTGRVIVLR